MTDERTDDLLPGDLTRLGLLALLEQDGPLHGYQLRRAFEQRGWSRWPAVAAGSAYPMLRKLVAEGHVDEVREEQSGKYPTRTVYAITPHGREEVRRLLNAAVVHVDTPLRSVDVALLFRQLQPLHDLRGQLEQRIHHVNELLEIARREQAQRSDIEALLLDHEIRLLEAELQWSRDALQLATV